MRLSVDLDRNSAQLRRQLLSARHASLGIRLRGYAKLLFRVFEKYRYTSVGCRTEISIRPAALIVNVVRVTRLYQDRLGAESRRLKEPVEYRHSEPYPAVVTLTIFNYP
jgi:hypothetical protein